MTTSALPSTVRTAAVVCCFGLLVLAGCNQTGRPPLARVHGRVTMDGKPLPRAHLRFEPKTRGRESYASTDANGEYELTYLGDAKGAAVGENVVRISTQSSNDPKTETVPPKYNAKTTLHFTVTEGENEAKFDLTSH